jgi:cytochrome o ubiquinol oxidase subunit 1
MAVQTDLIKDPHILTGKLHWGVIPYTDPVVLPVMIAAVLGGLALFALITYKGWWGYLWKEWITSVDHKKIGIMYVIVALVMLFRGFSDAVLMRTNQALSLPMNSAVAIYHQNTTTRSSPLTV